jgi:hypothetical protein
MLIRVADDLVIEYSAIESLYEYDNEKWKDGKIVSTAKATKLATKSGNSWTIYEPMDAVMARIEEYLSS